MSKIFEGKTIEEATAAGLKELGLTAENAEVLVLEQGSKGFFGLGAKPARIQIVEKKAQEAKPAAEEKKEEKAAISANPAPSHAPAKEEKVRQAKPAEKKKQPVKAAPEKEEECAPVDPSEDAKNAIEFLTGLMKIMNVDGKVELKAENKERVVFDIVTEDSSSVIGYRGEVLDSFQSLVGAVYNTKKEKYLKVVVDCENYRNKRESTLVSLANKLAQKAISSGRKITLEPMNPFERRVIHSALVDVEGVKTISEGKEPNRFVAIIPDNYDPSKGSRRDNFRRGGKGRGGRRDDGGMKKAEGKKTSAFSAGVFLGNSLKDKQE